jgi:hypothetical protein
MSETRASTCDWAGTIEGVDGSDDPNKTKSHGMMHFYKDEDALISEMDEKNTISAALVKGITGGGP